MLKKVIKRDGAKVDFEPSKVVNAVTAAMSRTDTGVDEDLVERIRLSISNSDKETLSVEEIQDLIEKKLMSSYSSSMGVPVSLIAIIMSLRSFIHIKIKFYYASIKSTITL